MKENSRWDERVFWSRGIEGKCHTVSPGMYVIEAPYLSASIGPVKSEDVTAIFTKNESDEIIDILPEYLAKKYTIWAISRDWTGGLVVTSDTLYQLS